MSRHRNVRSMNYSDEYDGYDDVYGHSMEDDYTISPSDAAFMYDRNRQPPQQMAAFLNEEDDIAEVDESELDTEGAGPQRRDSETYHRPALNELDEARLRSCLDEIRNVLGETVSEQVLVETVLKHEFNVARSLDEVLSSAASSANVEDPQTKRQRDRRDISKDQDENTEPFHSKSGKGVTIEKEDMSALKNRMSQLVIKNPTQINFPGNNNSPGALETVHSSEIAKRFNTGASKTLNLPKFQFNKSTDPLKENSSDEEDQGSLLSLISKHKKLPVAVNKFTSLADRANEYLKSKPLSQMLSPNCTEPLEISKSPEYPGANTFTSRPISFNMKVDENESNIDLSCALKSAMCRRSKEGGVKETVVHHQSGFIDEGLVERLSKLHCVEEFDCAGNARLIINAKVPRPKAVSSFGKVVCRRWSKQASPMISMSHREVLHEVTRFNFQTPSPDDVVKKHLRRNCK